ncbi:MAG: carbohydrate kinase [Rhizobiaceae bacterium]|nr:carbohydrate kinase [Rhizobiaceae bacterium]MCV0405576.1 carbohydrate kinase [Rhizobiaceae bacterium]
MIVCCGEALIDMLPRRSEAGEDAFAPYAGGAIFNTAIALGRLGCPVEFLSGLSTDLFGDLLRETLAKSRVGTRYAITSDRPTTLAFVRLDGGNASYTFYDENTAGRMVEPDRLPAIADEVAAMHFGAISLIPEPCGSAYEALMARETDRRVIMLDPNIRPGFIADPASHRKRMERMIAMADIVKLSDEDLAWFGEPGGDEEQARRMLDRGPRLVVITRGARGATAFTRSHRVSVLAPKVTVADTVGAGDTFNAGLLAALSDAGLLSKDPIAALTESRIADALSLGVRVAAVTVSRAGANPPWRHELG